jgi:hypothetical protein
LFVNGIHGVALTEKERRHWLGHTNPEGFDLNGSVLRRIEEENSAFFEDSILQQLLVPIAALSSLASEVARSASSKCACRA